MKAKTKHFFSLFKEALKGGEGNYTEGSIDRAIFLLSVPMILEMLMESLFAVVDVFFVSKVSVNAVATIGLTESVLTLVYSIAMGLSMGATAMVARRIGEGDKKAASIAGMNAIYIGLAFSLVISIVGFLFAERILEIMGGSAELIQQGVGYTRLMFSGNIVIVFLFLINGIFRGAGNAAIAMRSLWLANILNIILCPVFVFGFGPIPAFGVMGSAIATNIGRGAGVCYQCYYLFNGKSLIRITKETILLKWDIVKKMIVVASGGTGQFLIASASWVFLVKIISHFGSDALAGYTIGIRIIIFAILPAWGMANAAATLVGQNLGAQQPERAEKSVWRTAYFNMLFLAGITILFFFSAHQLVGFFTQEKEVIPFAVECLQYVCLGYIFYAYGMVISQSFNGAGDTRTPTILNIFGFWMVQIPLAYSLAVLLTLGPKGVYMAIAIAESLMAITGIILFKRGKWKLVKI